MTRRPQQPEAFGKALDAFLAPQSLDPKADIFAMRGIDRSAGCMVVVRPDQYVAHVLPLDGTAALAAFFDRFMLPAR